MSDFTPGPWEVETEEGSAGQWWVVNAEMGERLVNVVDTLNCDYRIDPETARANARLVAQSPAMYTLLRDLGGDGGDGFCEGCGRDIKSGQEHSPSCRINAILKAVEGSDE